MRNNSVHSDETGLSLGQIVQMLNETPFDTATGNVLSASTQSLKDGVHSSIRFMHRASLIRDCSRTCIVCIHGCKSRIPLGH
jgi:hypothetical protein